MRRNPKRFNPLKKAGKNNYRATTGNTGQRSAPDSMSVELPFESEVTVYNNAGQQYYSYYYRINAPYDPDPVGSSKKAGYFDYWANLYSRYRVLGATIEWNAVNAETFPVAIYSAPTTTTLTISAKADVFDIGEAPYSPPVMMLSNSTGMNRASQRCRVDFGDFVGNKESVKADDVYSSEVTTTPTKIIYFYFGFVTNSNLSSGVEMHVRILFRTLFTQRYQDVPNAFMRNRLKDSTLQNTINEEKDSYEQQIDELNEENGKLSYQLQQAQKTIALYNRYAVEQIKFEGDPNFQVVRSPNLTLPRKSPPIVAAEVLLSQQAKPHT